MVKFTTTDLWAGLAMTICVLFLRSVLPYTLRPLVKHRGSPHKVNNWCEHTFKFFFHVGMLIWGLVVVPNETWFSWTSTRGVWEGYPNQGASTALRGYYLIQMALYFTGLIYHFFEDRRKDFILMLLHHVCALGLLYGSYVCNFQRIGALVLLDREPSDLFLYLAKVAGFVQWDGLCTGSFVALVISWLLLRLLLYPFVIMRSSLIESVQVCGMEAYNTYYRSWWGFNLALAFFIPLDFYYFYLITKIALDRVRKGYLEDTREVCSPPPTPITCSDCDRKLD